MPNELLDNYAAFVSLDWADQSHDYSLSYPGSCKREHGKVQHKPEALMDWITELRNRFPEGSIAICMEQFRGSLAYFLMQFEFVTLFLVNPITLKRYREAFYPSGAKDDARDSDLLLDLLETKRDRLRAWNPEPAHVRKLDLLNRHRRKLVGKITSLTNELSAYLKGYYPQALLLAGELDTIQACDFLEKWPSLQTVKKAKKSQLEKFYNNHNCRSSEKIQERLQIIDRAVAITNDEALCSVYQLTVKAIVAQLRELLKSVRHFDEELGKTFDQHPEKSFYEALPGAGPVLQPRLAAALGANRSRYQTAAELLAFSGIAPVTEKSGQSCWVHWRFACPKFVRQTFVEFANHSRKKSVWAAAYYQHLRSREKSHQAALRALAFKWIRVLFRCWKNSTNYNEQIYIAALHARSSPIAKLIA